MHRELSVESMRNLLSGNDFYYGGMGSVGSEATFVDKRLRLRNLRLERIVMFVKVT